MFWFNRLNDLHVGFCAEIHKNVDGLSPVPLAIICITPKLYYSPFSKMFIYKIFNFFQRDAVVKCFREGKIWVLICTELMARGIDFKGVNLVINYDFPPSSISYVHRIGRAGRAGRTGKAITFFTQEDTPLLRR